MDWMTAAVEIIGLVILCVWTVIPVREFAGIFRRLRARRRAQTVSPRGTPAPPADHPDDLRP